MNIEVYNGPRKLGSLLSIEKLVALIPPPNVYLVRWAGVFAPNSPYRKDITLRLKIKKAFQFKQDEGEEKKAIGLNNYSLAF